MIELLIVLALAFAVGLLVQYIEHRSQRPVVARRPSCVVPKHGPSIASRIGGVIVPIIFIGLVVFAVGSVVPMLVSPRPVMTTDLAWLLLLLVLFWK